MRAALEGCGHARVVAPGSSPGQALRGSLRERLRVTELSQQTIARMSGSDMRGMRAPDVASLHPGYAFVASEGRRLAARLIALGHVISVRGTRTLLSSARQSKRRRAGSAM